MANGSTKRCERCERPAMRGLRYCQHFRRVVLREMHKSGYLRDDNPPDNNCRTSPMNCAPHDPRTADDLPSLDNIIKEI